MKIILGSRNPHKLKEMRALLPGLDLDVLPAGIAEAPETGQTFFDNAREKSETYARATGHWVLADDSGLVVESLNGDPGVRSARYAGEEASDQENNEKLLEELQEIDQRQASFVCVLSLASPDAGEVFHVEGQCSGQVLRGPDGVDGFGYDPLFLSDELGVSFARATAEMKGRVSHRARACQKFIDTFQKHFAKEITQST